jgi:RNA polymerase sigma-70 factor (ECF subfamily)
MDRSVVEQVYRARAGELTAQLMRQYPQCGDCAPDAVQHAFVKLAEYDQPVHDPSGWVARAASNYMIDQLRKTRRLVQETPELSLDAFPAISADLDADEERRHAVEAMHRALATIGEPGKTMLVLKYIQGCDYDQIAEALQLPKGSIGTTLLRARRKLRDLLQAQGIHSSAA